METMPNMEWWWEGGLLKTKEEVMGLIFGKLLIKRLLPSSAVAVFSWEMGEKSDFGKTFGVVMNLLL